MTTDARRHANFVTPRARALHLFVASLMGTAKHLVAAHGLTAEEIDADDPQALAHDHVVLHGGTVDAAGRLRFPAP